MAQYSGRAYRRSGHGWNSLHAGQCGRAICADCEHSSHFATARFGCDGGGARKCRRWNRVSGHGDFHAGSHEWHHHERGANSVCCGARPLFLFCSRRGASAISYTFNRDYRASGTCDHLVVIGGSFRQFFSLAIFAEWLFYMVAASTVFLFRRREPGAPRPYRVWGYPMVPSLFVLAAAVLLYFTFRDNWPNSGYGSLVILAGMPVFYLFARKRQA